MGITLPLLVIAPFTLYLVFPKLTKAKFFEGDLRRGELVLFERDTVFHTAVFSLSAKYMLLHGIRVSDVEFDTIRNILFVWRKLKMKFVSDILLHVISNHSL